LRDRHDDDDEEAAEEEGGGRKNQRWWKSGLPLELNREKETRWNVTR
jgi:hypothetical protein